MSREYVLDAFRPPVNLQIDYARELNAQQHAAVTVPPGPSLVLAGAGAGKTRTLVFRVAFLLEQGIPAERILLLTFTNKAAREMMNRVADLLAGDQQSLWGGTFHSIGHRVLRRHADLLGFRRDFTILDREDSRDLLKTAVAASKINSEVLFPKADVLQDILSLAANMAQPLPNLLTQQFPHLETLAGDIGLIAERYAQRKAETNVMDFDDLQLLWLRLLKDVPDIRERYQRRFQFILVDEYQDTNQIQGEIIDLLAARHHNVMVVGDDSQSIYSWRGANFRNILDFPKRYPEAAVYKIETNYRSTPEILAVANAAIQPNLQQFHKVLSPARASGIKPVIVPCADGDEQARFVAQRLLQLREEGGDLNKMAVLYRSHFHALELQLELTRRNIPFAITSGVRFFEQAHVKDVVSYVRLVCNPLDELAFKRLVMLMPGVGPKSADALWSTFRPVALAASRLLPVPAAENDDGPPESAVLPPDVGPVIATALQECRTKVPKKAIPPWTQFVITISQLEAINVRKSASRMIQVVLEAGYDDYLKQTYTNYRSRLEDLEQLASFAQQFKTPADFLAQLSLLSNLEAEDEGAKANDERVRLSSIHQAKGLEFDVVFIIMLCDGMFPSGRTLDDPDQEEEERRLFYVAITRARNELYLCYPLIRMAQGYTGDIMQRRSRFLADIPEDLREEWRLRAHEADHWKSFN